MSLRKFITSLGHARNGLRTTWEEEQNFRIELLLAIIVVAIMIVFRFPIWSFAVVILACASVLAAEIINTVVEDFCDKVEPNHDPAIKKIKDMAAAFVLVTSLGAGLSVIGIFIHVFFNL